MQEQTYINHGLSLYIHIPFCKTICPYCGFYKVKNQLDLEAPLITALGQEIQFYVTQFSLPPIKSIFLGGGTPSLLSKKALTQLFETIHAHLTLSPECEITMEINPENITKSLLTCYKQRGINRLSIGVQSFNPKDLTFLGRTHTPNDLNIALTTLLNHSSDWNYNIDLITGLPHLTLDDLMNTLQKALAFNPPHISTYTLSIEPHTLFEKKDISPLDQAIELTHYTQAHDFLTQKNYTHYEVSAFAKPGYESQHNLTYWNYNPFIGIGPSANSFFNNCRYTNPRSLTDYIKNPLPIFSDPIDQNTQIKEFLISNLRLQEGFKLSTFRQRFNQSFEERYSTIIKKLQNQELINIANNRCQTTQKGRVLLNTILVDLM